MTAPDVAASHNTPAVIAELGSLSLDVRLDDALAVMRKLLQARIIGNWSGTPTPMRALSR